MHVERRVVRTDVVGRCCHDPSLAVVFVMCVCPLGRDYYRMISIICQSSMCSTTDYFAYLRPHRASLLSARNPIDGSER